MILSIKSAPSCGQTRPHISKHHILKSCFCVTRFPQVIICRKNHSSRQNIEFQILFAKRYVILVNKFAYPSIFGHFPFSEIKLIVCNLGADGDGSDLSKILQRLLEKYLEVNLRNIATSTCTTNPGGDFVALWYFMATPSNEHFQWGGTNRARNGHGSS